MVRRYLGLTIPDPQPLTPQDYLINFNTPAQLINIANWQNINMDHMDDWGYFPVPPPEFAEGITPFNVDKCEIEENECGTFCTVPLDRYVSPFDYSRSL
jgi:hypothetical protein